VRKIALILAFLFLLIAPSTSLAKDYTASECPVVGNKSSGIYHVPGGAHYRKMLKQNKQGDNRECFQNELAAKGAGYRKSKR
jgi:hypothetical protein